MTDKNCMSCNGSGYYISADIGTRNPRKPCKACEPHSPLVYALCDENSKMPSDAEIRRMNIQLQQAVKTPLSSLGKLSHQCQYDKKVDVDNAWIVRDTHQDGTNKDRLEAFRAKWNLIN